MPVKFERADNALDIVGMDGVCGGQIHFFKFSVERFAAVPDGICRKLLPDFAGRPFFGKINAVEHGLDIKPGAADKNRNPPGGIDFLHIFGRQFLKQDNIKFFVRIQLVNQVMRDALHFFWPDFGGADIHVTVHLHGIRGNDRSADSFCQFYGKRCFAGRGRPGEYDKRRFHIIQSS